MFVHGDNIAQKEQNINKGTRESKLLQQIRS